MTQLETQDQHSSVSPITFNTCNRSSSPRDVDKVSATACVGYTAQQPPSLSGPSLRLPVALHGWLRQVASSRVGGRQAQVSGLAARETPKEKTDNIRVPYCLVSVLSANIQTPTVPRSTPSPCSVNCHSRAKNTLKTVIFSLEVIFRA